MTPVIEQFEQGLQQFVGLVDNRETRVAVLRYVNDFIEKHKDQGELLLAYLLNDFKDPYEGML